jgi:predicted MFS family arabinose efflux permease
MSASIAFIIGSALLAIADSVSVLLVGRAIVGAAVGKM